jgi:glycosyltransferase involved in cell wall biosynthesis
MRIRHVLPQLAMGILPRDPLDSALTGAINVAWNLAIQQASAGHEVEIIAPAEPGPRARQHIGGVQVHWLPEWRHWRSRRYDFSNLLPLLRYTMTARSMDVTHVHGNPFFVVRSRSRAHILHLHSSPLRQSPRYDRAVARADRVICCSRFILDELLQAVPYPSTEAHVVHSGVDQRFFAHMDRRQARTALGLGNDQETLLYVGRVGPEKGLLILVRALREIKRRGGAVPYLLVAGSSILGFEGHQAAWEYLHAYERLVLQEAEGLPIRFLGPVPQVRLPALYRAADIFVCPSVYQEPFGMVNVEAAAAGAAVIASRVGGIPEAVVHESTGLLVPPDDPGALAEAILRLLRDEVLRLQLARRGQEAAARFDWQTLTAQVMTIYQDVLAGARQPMSALAP